MTRPCERTFLTYNLHAANFNPFKSWACFGEEPCTSQQSHIEMLLEMQNSAARRGPLGVLNLKESDSWHRGRCCRRTCSLDPWGEKQKHTRAPFLQADVQTSVHSSAWCIAEAEWRGEKLCSRRKRQRKRKCCTETQGGKGQQRWVETW